MQKKNAAIVQKLNRMGFKCYKRPNDEIVCGGSRQFSGIGMINNRWDDPVRRELIFFGLDAQPSKILTIPSSDGRPITTDVGYTKALEGLLTVPEAVGGCGIRLRKDEINIMYKTDS